MVVACGRQSYICDLSLGHAHQRVLASFWHSSVVVINRLACSLLGEFEEKETKRVVGLF